MTEQERDAFLAETRLGILSTVTQRGHPLSVPVWFEWDGSVVRMFSFEHAPKVKRLRANPRASLLVVNHLKEREAWVAFDGDVAISDGGGFQLAERLVPKYWDLEDAARGREFATWRESPSMFCLLTLTPSRIRTG